MSRYVVCVCILLGACAESPQEQVKADVAAHLKKSLNDPSSYEPGEFTITPFSREDSAQQAERRIATQYFAATDASERSTLLRQRGALLGQHDTTRIGWQVQHSYRAKNAFGALMKASSTYVVYPSHEVVEEPAD